MAFAAAVRLVCREGEEDTVAEILKQMNAVARGEDGVLVYQLHRRPDDPRTFFLYEQYVDEAAFERHRSSPQFMRLIPEELVPRLEVRDHDFYTTWP